MSSQKDASVFSRNIWQTLVVMALFSILFVVYVYSEKQIDRANEIRLNSFLLADELRQSSDDLTRMVRSYIATGNPLYKHHYQEILDIRNGNQPRPIDYQNIYWDLVGLDDERPRPLNTLAQSLIDRMDQAGFTAEEMNKLSEAKNNSDALTHSEFKAMQLIELKGSDSQMHVWQQQAINLLHDQHYHDAKKSIMRPIGEFSYLMNKRTAAAVQTAKNIAVLVQIVFVLTGMVLFFMLWRLNQSLKSILGSSISDVHEHITRIGQGDFSHPLNVTKEEKESILGWLDETQTRLKDLIENNNRLKQLYAALSQCNQSIVRSKNEVELFQNICQNTMHIDGMKMAWIGKLDEDGHFIKPIAYYGEGTEYLDGLMISVDSSDSFGRGPTGYAFRSGNPFWCQDFMNDSATLPWHERGQKFGWGASASLPLYSQNQVVGVLTLYSSRINAFDESTQELLVEMASDIGYALDSFAHAIAREKAEITLSESEEFYRGIFASVNETVIILKDSLIIDCNDRALELFDVSKSEFIGMNICDFDINCLHNDLGHFLNASEEGQISAIECSITTKSDIKAKIVEINLSPFGNVSGKWILVARDITQKLEQEKLYKMQARQAQLGEMIAMIAHQWRQPLSIINAITSQIRLQEIMKDQEDPFLIENLIKIEQQCIYLSQTITDYRELSDPNKPKEFVSMAILLKHAVNLMDHTLKSKGIEIRQNIIQDIQLSTYHNEVVQVLLAFFKNSLDAFEENRIIKRIITVTIESENEFGIISVKDNAGGILKELIHRLFTPYFTTKNKTYGTGLGLYMSKMIIEKHCNGVLEVSSENQETLFRIKLPR